MSSFGEEGRRKAGASFTGRRAHLLLQRRARRAGPPLLIGLECESADNKRSEPPLEMRAAGEKIASL